MGFHEQTKRSQWFHSNKKLKNTAVQYDLRVYIERYGVQIIFLLDTVLEVGNFVKICSREKFTTA